VAALAADLPPSPRPGVEVDLHPGSAEIVNVVARVRGRAPGRRIVFNGHLDTYPLGDRTSWSSARKVRSRTAASMAAAPPT